MGDWLWSVRQSCLVSVHSFSQTMLVWRLTHPHTWCLGWEDNQLRLRQLGSLGISPYFYVVSSHGLLDFPLGYSGIQRHMRKRGRNHVVFYDITSEVTHYLLHLLFVNWITKAWPISWGKETDSICWWSKKFQEKHVKLEILLCPFLENIISLSWLLPIMIHPEELGIFQPWIKIRVHHTLLVGM